MKQHKNIVPWKIHDKYYDLTEFMYSHPGGLEIIKLAQNTADCTVLFETYHAFSSKYESIKKQLSLYEVDLSTQPNTETKSKQPPTYDFTSYRKLVRRVKDELELDMTNIKANWFWYIKNICLAALYVGSIYYMLTMASTTFEQIIGGFIVGFLLYAIGFNVMHDGMHWGLFSTSYTKLNWILGSIVGNLLLYNPIMWFYHHTYAHHSYTGNDIHDPDMKHFRPFARKFDSDNRIIKFICSIQHYLITFIAVIFPGMGFGQAFAYLISNFTGRIFGTPIPKKKYSSFDICISLLKLYILTYFGPAGIISYIISCNLFYHINVLGDHDVYESAVTNHMSDNSDPDWLKIQISNSANFVPNNLVWTHLFGGINYQIEHHLFPNICHVHYPRIAQIVKAYCKENNIPHVEHHSLINTYKSFLQTMKYYAYDVKSKE